jgi:fatty acid desaturase
MGRAAFPVLSVLNVLLQTGLAVAAYYNRYWIALALALVESHVIHGVLICLHEASHGLLRKNRQLNEIDGVMIGTFSLTSFSLYRAAHQLHHAHLASERDEELWPFVDPSMPRWRRVLAAICELTLGIVYTPFLFLRIFLRSGSPIRNRKVRRRIWMEYALIALVWGSILTADTFLHGWKYFFWMYFLPGWLAGNAQSLRKYVEHVGLTGATVNGSTRSIVAQGWLAEFLCFTLLHEPYHGVHHWRSGIPHAELPLHAEALEPKAPEERPPCQSFAAAFRDFFKCLDDPRVGAQWR